MTYCQIEACRVCGNQNLIEILDLGTQVLTGVFPSSTEQDITAGPLRLVKCHGDESVCHLLQLKHTYNLGELYGENYGYRSGLNKSMVLHLQAKVEKILNMVSLQPDNLVIDIGSNDGTTLGFYPRGEWDLVGIDPTGNKFSEYYAEHVQLVPDFFSADVVHREFGERKAKIVTSFSMFYDLEDPVCFAREVADVLAADGIWILEQSYMPEMMVQNSYDTVCHEHLEYYGLAQIDWIAKQVGLKILDVEFNNVNGGSFSVSMALEDSQFHANTIKLNKILSQEVELKELSFYQKFADRVAQSKAALIARLTEIKAANQRVYGLGASTKGNVILQYCGISSDLLPKIGEVNQDKYSCFTPGSLIPIVSESEILNLKPDYILVLPWHFKEFFESSKKFVDTKLIYPI